MPIVYLKQTTYVDDVLRSPVEGGIFTSDTEEARLEKNGLLADPAENHVDPVADDLDDQTVAELRVIAKAEEIDLHGATRSTDLIELIRTARTARTA